MNRISNAAIFVSVLLCWSMLAAAKDDPQSDVLGEITVTALRRSERLQDVPVSITALTGSALADQKVTNAADLVSQVPNFQAASTVGEDIPVFSLRGISMFDYSVNQQGPVATYFDEVYRGSFPLMGLSLFDMERVEVLRGPQGTLYGKNTTGGAVNFISKRPDFSTEADVNLGYGNYSRKEANGDFQIGVGEHLALRAAFTYTKADGWFNNLLAGYPDLGSTNQWGVRLSALLKANDSLDFLLRLNASKANPTNYGIYARPGEFGIGAGVYEAYGITLPASYLFRTGLGSYDILDKHTPDRLHKTAGASLTTTWRMSDVLNLTSVTSTDYGRLFIPEDADGSPMEVLEDDITGVARQYAEDLRISSSFDGGLNYVLGVYYNHETISSGTAFHYFTDIPLPCQASLVACISQNHYDQTKSTKAAYVDLNYKFNGRFTLRGGLRFTHDAGSIDNYLAQLANADGTVVANLIPGDPDPANLFATTSKSFGKSQVTGKVGLDFKPSESTLIYGSVSRGYRASAFNAQAYFVPSELNVAAPETVWAYEIGAKTQPLSILTVNAALFYYRYQNQQSLSIDSNTLAQNLINLPKSRVYGGELEISARPLEPLRINLGVGLLNTRIQEGEVSGSSLEGHRLPNAPSVSANAAVNWQAFSGDFGKVVLTLDGNLVSRQFFELQNVDRLSQKFYALVNGRIAYKTTSDRFEFLLWARNLANRYYYTSAIDVSGFGFDYFHLGAPRMFGGEFKAHF